MEKLIESPHFTVWELIKTYWQSPHRKSAIGWYSVMVILTICVVVTQVGLTYWSNYFYDALQKYDQPAAMRLLGLFFVLAFTFITLVVSRYYITQVFGLRWRRWLTQQCLGRWLQGRGYYYLENFDKKTDNPDQRIQDDVGGLVSNSIDLSISFIDNVLSFIGFSYVLWGLSGELRIPLGPFGTFVLHHYLLWVSVTYSIIGTLITFKVGRPLVPLNFEQQRREATFRFAAIDLRSHSENVALYRGEQHQKGVLQELFGWVLDNWYRIIVRQTKLLSFTAGFGQLSVALPLIVVLPNYFGKVIMLGGLMQSLRAFSGLQDSLSFFVNSFPQIAVWRATGQRLTTFLNQLTDVENRIEKQSHLTVSKQPEDQITAKGLIIKTPQEESLLTNVNETFVHGKNYLIKGASGIGKSTFLRVIAGIWPFVSGEVFFPQHQRILFLPQTPYMPIGTLAEAMIFPNQTSPHLQSQLEAILHECQLDKFIPRLHEVARWSEQLSPGEQQRIAFARLLLQKPDWVFMDESTSMLDVASEKYLYELVRKQLPNCSIVSVGHRPTLDAFHDHVVDMGKYRTAAAV